MSAFIDTNLLVYSVSVDPADAPKRDVALALLAEADIHLSIQVVQEFINPFRLATILSTTSEPQATLQAFLRHVPELDKRQRKAKITKSEKVSQPNARCSRDVNQGDNPYSLASCGSEVG